MNIPKFTFSRFKEIKTIKDKKYKPADKKYKNKAKTFGKTV